MDMEIIIDILLDEISYIFIDTFAIRSHLSWTKFNLRLAFKYGFFDINSDGSYKPIAHVGILIILIIELLYRLSNMFFECALMRSTLCSVLTIHETMILFTILIGMSEGDFYIFSHDMNNRIQAVVRHRIVQQISQTIPTFDATSVVHDG